MKIYSRCPICNNPMVTSFGDSKVPGIKQIKSISIQECIKYLSHKISIYSISSTQEIYKIELMINTNPMQYVVWAYTYMECWIFSEKEDGTFTKTILPFFDPDLSNYKKLIEKVKTYLIFS